MRYLDLQAEIYVLDGLMNNTCAEDVDIYHDTVNIGHQEANIH